MEWSSDDRESIGSSQSPTTASPPTSPLAAYGSRDNLNRVLQLDTSTGRSVARLARRRPLRPLGTVSDPVVITSSPVHQPPASMYGRTTPQSRVPGLNLESLNPGSSLERYLSTDQSNVTGNGSGISPQEEIFQLSLLRSEFKVIGPSVQSLQTLLNQLEWNEVVKSSGVAVELASRGVLGVKLVPMLILRILEPSFGVDTEIRSVLSSMNFEEVSMSDTFSDGWTATLSLWRSKDPPPYSGRQDIGLPPIYPQRPGTPI